MLAIAVYIKERFPLPAVLLFASGYAAVTIGTALSVNLWQDNLMAAIKLTLLITVCFTGFLLRQRVVDEFKDAVHDAKYFPDRPYSRGLITKKQLIGLGLFALILELYAVMSLGMTLFYLPVFLFSLLMAKEFFMSVFLQKHFTLYFLFHECIFILFGFYFWQVLQNIHSTIDNFFLYLLIVTIAPISVEIIRKFAPRKSKNGLVVNDSYGSVWGILQAAFILSLLCLLQGFLLSYSKGSSVFILFTLFTSCGIYYSHRYSAKLVAAIGASNFVGLAILSNFLW